jgi:hypothetical protein
MREPLPVPLTCTRRCDDSAWYRRRAQREPVRLADLALAFDETVASTVDVQVEGRNFFPGSPSSDFARDHTQPVPNRQR